MRSGTSTTTAGFAIAVVAALTAAVSLVGAVAPPPAESAGRNRDGFRDPDRRRKGNTNSPYETRQADNAQPPARFVAQFEGRIVVVSAETGRIESYLTTERPGGGASDPSVSPDGRAVWFARGDGTCASHLASVPVAGGDEQRVPGSGEVGPESRPLPRPGRPQLAYARRQCDKADSAALIVGDLAGLEGRGQSGLVPLAWNRSGDRLLAATAAGGKKRLLEVSKAGAVVARSPLEPADAEAGCRLEVVGFSPDDNDGYVAFRRCGPADERGRRSLVLLDKDGVVRRTVLRLSRSQDFADRPAFDSTGHSLLYATVSVDSGAQAANGERRWTLWLWRDGEIRHLDRQSRFRQPAWLP